jgi:quinol monooxygenase YgiN
MEIVIMARFYTREGAEAALADAIAEVAPAVRAEPGCTYYGAFRSTIDPRRFFLLSRWADEELFRRHSQSPHILKFLERAEALIDHPLDISHAVQIA